MPDSDKGSTAGASADVTQTDQGQTAGRGHGDTVPSQGQEFYVATFKDKGEAEKGYKAAQAKITEVTTKLSEMESEMESLKSKADMKEVLLALSQKREEPDSGAQRQNFDQFVETIRDDLTNAPDQAVRKLTTWQHALVEEERKGRSKDMEAIQSEIRGLKTELEETKERSDSFYQEHKDVIDELVTGGMKVKHAKSFLKKFADKVRPAEEEGTPPILPAQSRGGPAAKPPEAYLTAEDKERFKRDLEMSDEQIAKMESDYQARAKK